MLDIRNCAVANTRIHYSCLNEEYWPHVHAVNCVHEYNSEVHALNFMCSIASYFFNIYTYSGRPEQLFTMSYHECIQHSRNYNYYSCMSTRTLQIINSSYTWFNHCSWQVECNFPVDSSHHRLSLLNKIFSILDTLQSIYMQLLVLYTVCTCTWRRNLAYYGQCRPQCTYPSC